jgi:hypothetical protein
LHVESSTDEVQEASGRERGCKVARPADMCPILGETRSSAAALVSDVVLAPASVAMEVDGQGHQDHVISHPPDEPVVDMPWGAGRIGSSQAVSSHRICRVPDGRPGKRQR